MVLSAEAAIEEVRGWLARENIEDCLEALLENGYDDLDAISQCTDAELEELESIFPPEALAVKKTVALLVHRLQECGIHRYREHQGFPSEEGLQTPSPTLIREGALYFLRNDQDWVERWFRLTERHLRWFASSKDTDDAEGTILLDSSVAYSSEGPTSFRLTVSHRALPPLSYQIASLRDADEYRGWCDAVNNILDDVARSSAESDVSSTTDAPIAVRPRGASYLRDTPTRAPRLSMDATLDQSSCSPHLIGEQQQQPGAPAPTPAPPNSNSSSTSSSNNGTNRLQQQEQQHQLPHTTPLPYRRRTSIPALPKIRTNSNSGTQVKRDYLPDLLRLPQLLGGQGGGGPRRAISKHTNSSTSNTLYENEQDTISELPQPSQDGGTNARPPLIRSTTSPRHEAEGGEDTLGELPQQGQDGGASTRPLPPHPLKRTNTLPLHLSTSTAKPPVPPSPRRQKPPLPKRTPTLTMPPKPTLPPARQASNEMKTLGGQSSSSSSTNNAAAVQPPVASSNSTSSRLHGGGPVSLSRNTGGHVSVSLSQSQAKKTGGSSLGSPTSAAGASSVGDLRRANFARQAIRKMSLKDVRLENLLREGTHFKKHSAGSKNPKKCFLQFTEDLQRMVWLDPKDLTVQGYVFSLDILSVTSAAPTKGKNRLLISTQHDDILEIEGPDKTMVTSWQNAMEFLIARQESHEGRAALVMIDTDRLPTQIQFRPMLKREYGSSSSGSSSNSSNSSKFPPLVLTDTDRLPTQNSTPFDAQLGDIFTKFDRRGNTAVRRVFMDEKHTKIEWTAVDGKRQAKDSSSIPIAELVDVRTDPKNPRMLIVRTIKRNLQLEAQYVETVQSWKEGMQAFIPIHSSRRQYE